MKRLVWMVVLAMVLTPALWADEFVALPGLWKTTSAVRGASDPLRSVWHCVDEGADPWVSYAQIRDLPGMVCSRTSLQRDSTSLKWRMQCHGAGLEESRDSINSEGAVIFDSAQHYTGWIRINGLLMGYPVDNTVDIDGSRQAACTSPED